MTGLVGNEPPLGDQSSAIAALAQDCREGEASPIAKGVEFQNQNLGAPRRRLDLFQRSRHGQPRARGRRIKPLQ